MTALLRNARFRSYVYQVALVGGACLLLVTFVLTTRQNLVAQGIATGFDFLQRSTGWDVSFAILDYTIRDPYWKVFLVGFLNTLLVGSISLVAATVLGTLIGMARVGQNPLLGFLGTVYVEIFRNVPLILQGLFWYAILTHLPPPRQAFTLGGWFYLSSRGVYAPFLALPTSGFLMLGGIVVGAVAAAVAAIQIPALQTARALRRRVLWGILLLALAAAGGVVALNYDARAGLISFPQLQGLRFNGGMRLMPEFSALVIAIVFFGSAYIAEIVRGGLLSVNRGQIEAARSLGLTPFRVYRLVRIPLALRTIVPPLGNQFVWLMKATTVGIAFGFSDLFMVSSTAINQSGQTIEILLIMMSGFLLINYLIASAMNAVNRSIALKGYETKRQ
ncbi:MAG: ABC transporter permease subunit [Alphaproteobacteria bacterium]|nr:ABC transporter permease subunit [Alphaproteobacteria bacterium]